MAEVNVRNSVKKKTRGRNKTNLQILSEFANQKRLRIALGQLGDGELVELTLRLEELKKN